MSFRNQITGLIRFSVVTTGDFYPGFDGPEALAAFLFDEARLARRFAMFEALTLPALARQTDGDFACILLTSEALPKPWMDRLLDLVAPHRWAQVQAVAPGQHYSLIQRAFAALPAEGATHRTTFRLDDDDAVDLGYVARLRRLAAEVQRLGGPDRPIALGFNRGLYADLGRTPPDLFDARERTPLSVGAAVVAPAGWRNNVYLRNHRALAQFHDCWSEAESFVFLRTLHRDNKSRPHMSGNQRELHRDAVEGILRDRFGLDPAGLAALAARCA